MNAVQRQRIIRCGWLKKQGGMVRTWHRRWFCLNNDFLFYFAKEDDSRPLGCIFLPGNRVSEVPFNPDDPEKCLFEISAEVSLMDDPGKGQTKMAPNHETYILWATNDEERQKWIKDMRKVMYSSFGGAIFGQSLVETMAYEHKLGRRLPFLMEQCVNFLTENGLEVEGIFRLPGRNLLIKDLKERFDSAERVIFDDDEVDVHTVASLLKLYLRELPQSVIPAEYYQKFMNIALRFQGSQSNDGKQKAIDDLRVSLTDLPEDNFNVLSFLCKFLALVGKHSDVNKMTVLNIATVFGPNIIRNVSEADSAELLMATADITHQLVFMMIEYEKELFGEKQAETVPVGNLLDLEPYDRTSVLKPTSLNLMDCINKELYGTDVSEKEANFQNLDFNLLALAGETSSPVAESKPVAPARRKRVVQRRGENRKVVVSSSTEELETHFPVVQESDIMFQDPQSPESKLPNGQLAEEIQKVDEDVNSKCARLEKENKELQEIKVKQEVKINEMKMKIVRLERYIKELSSSNSVIIQRYESRISTMDNAHRASVKTLQDKLAAEKKSTDEAVKRVMILQTQLQHYNLKFGELPD
ncbi:rho GTPase-activating protein 24-like isoform X1 [Saccostrea echinata]|uniref:rho GTPase-activating protein 24-like isoform X1 n=1 Tax=Saccostrea echinata TaxID=191078 RepID=UPI002A8014F9|nr:rho GTPase-activating protein 24-like isoform X1 [Saccostrea echinata]